MHLYCTSTRSAAAHRICADGGANRLYDLAHAHRPAANAHAAFLPDVILGDLDSLRPGVCDAYTKAGVQVVSENCQDSTDLQKCLAYASRMLAPEAKLCPLGTSLDGGYPRLRPLVIAVGALTPTDESTACVHYTAPDTGALGGRLDHTIANLASLTRFPHLRVVLMGDGNLAQVVPPGRSIIVPVPDVEGPTCGLVPLFGDVECTTEGLEWDLHAQTMSMTGLISTSNRIVKGAVHVQSNAPLLWTVEWSCGAQNR